MSIDENIGTNPFEDAANSVFGFTPASEAPTFTPAPAPQPMVAPAPVARHAPATPMAVNAAVSALPDLGSEDSVPDMFADFGDEVEEAETDEMEVPMPESVDETTIEAALPTEKAHVPTGSVRETNIGEIENPLAAAIDAVEQKSIFAAPPVFEYGAATEDIADVTQTFDALRISKAADYPELEDEKRVSWTVTYGKVTKTVSNVDAKKKKIGEMKSSIETSKEFMDALKKSKDKNPRCVLKPRVTAQSKGESAYRGVFTSIEAAEDAGKVISIIPAYDGNVYEMRREEIGIFTTKAENCREFSDIRAGFTPALPLVPNEMLAEIIAFFRAQMSVAGNYEAIANILWDKEAQTFVTYIPRQTVTHATVNADISDMPDSDRYLHYVDIHSHNSMPAKFSPTDDADEKATRVYAVMGRLDRHFPDISVRISNGGKFLPIDADTVFEPVCRRSDYPAEWDGRITVSESESRVLGL